MFAIAEQYAYEASVEYLQSLDEYEQYDLYEQAAAELIYQEAYVEKLQELIRG